MVYNLLIKYQPQLFDPCVKIYARTPQIIRYHGKCSPSNKIIKIGKTLPTLDISIEYELPKCINNIEIYKNTYIDLSNIKFKGIKIIDILNHWNIILIVIIWFLKINGAILPVWKLMYIRHYQ